MSVSRRTVLQALGGAGLTALGGTAASEALAVAGSVSPGAAPTGSGAAADPLFTFVSMPDFFNGDVADLSGLTTWDGGPNSINQSWQDAIDQCLGVIVEHRPDAVFLAGDMVEGHWNIDTGNRQLFGAVSQGTDPDSIAQCRSAITAAGDVYYPFLSRIFSSRGLPLYPVVGDHEILDDRSGPLNDRWSPSGFHQGVPDNRYYLVDHAKQVWTDHFTRPGGERRFTRHPSGAMADTAYAVAFGDALTLITVDVFMRHAQGVRLGVFHEQLTWLADEIRRAKRRGHLVVVQGHIPIIQPTRWLASGRLRVPEGRSSELYRVLEREGADFYFCGEVHDTTVHQRGRRAPVQISHGCIFQYGLSFLVGRLYPDHRLVIDSHEIPVATASHERALWVSDTGKLQRTFLEFGTPAHTGRLVYRHGEVTERTAKLGVYHPRNDPYGLRGHQPTVLV